MGGTTASMEPTVLVTNLVYLCGQSKLGCITSAHTAHEMLVKLSDSHPNTWDQAALEAVPLELLVVQRAYIAVRLANACNSLQALLQGDVVLDNCVGAALSAKLEQ